jgi:hypothetical protein
MDAVDGRGRINTTTPVFGVVANGLIIRIE